MRARIKVAIVAGTLGLATSVAAGQEQSAAHERTAATLLDGPRLSESLDGARHARDVGPASKSERRRASLWWDVGHDYQRFFGSRESYATLALGLAASLSVKPFDNRVASSGFNLELPRNEDGTLDAAFDPGSLLGSSLVQVGGALATFGVGHLVQRPGSAALGRDLVRAQLLTQGVTQLIKYSVRRTRPDESSRTSYPSGHASGTFASATVLHRHFGWKAGVPAFGVASYVAASRLAENKHYLSDVVLGAAIGITAGRTVTFSAGSTRFDLAPLAAPGGAGVQISVFRP